MAKAEHNNNLQSKLDQPTNKILLFLLELPSDKGQIYFSKITRALMMIKSYGRINDALNNIELTTKIAIESALGKPYRAIAAELNVSVNFVRKAVSTFERALAIALPEDLLEEFGFTNRYANAHEERIKQIIQAYDQLGERIAMLSATDPLFCTLWEENPHYAALLNLLADGYSLNEIFQLFGVTGISTKAEDLALNKFVKLVQQNSELDSLPGYDAAKMLLFGKALKENTTWFGDNAQNRIYNMSFMNLHLFSPDNRTELWMISVFLHLLPLLQKSLPVLFSEELAEYQNLDVHPRYLTSAEKYLEYFRYDRMSSFPHAIKFILILMTKRVEVKTIGLKLAVYIEENDIDISKYGIDIRGTASKEGTSFMYQDTLASTTMRQVISAGTKWLQNVLLLQSNISGQFQMEHEFSRSREEEINYLNRSLFNFGKEN